MDRDIIQRHLAISITPGSRPASSWSRWRSFGMSLALGSAFVGCMARSPKSPCLCTSSDAAMPLTISAEPATHSATASATPASTPAIKPAVAAEPSTIQRVVAVIAQTHTTRNKPTQSRSVTAEKPAASPSAPTLLAPTITAKEPRSGLAEPSWISSLASHFDGTNCPTVIHTSSRVAVAVPCALESAAPSRADSDETYSRINAQKTWVKTVVLRKKSGPDQGACRSELVQNGRAVFGDLTPGSYDVFYLKDANKRESTRNVIPTAILAGSVPAHRRIVVASPSVAGAIQQVHGSESSAAAESSVVTSAWQQAGGEESDEASVASDWGSATSVHDWLQDIGAVPDIGPGRFEIGLRAVLEGAESRANEGWRLLAEDDLTGAIREFEASILSVAKSCETACWQGSDDDARAQARLLQRVLKGSPQVAQALIARRAKHEGLARELAAYVHRQPALAHSFYGLAKTYDAMRKQTKASKDESAHLAVVFYLTATLLDQEHADAANDVAVLYHRFGWLKRAELYLRHANRLRPGARHAYNLGCVYWDGRKPYDARQWWEKALSSDPQCARAALAMIRFRLSDVAAAVDASDCRQLALDLRDVSDRFGADSPEGQWASGLLQYLSLLGHELRLNREHSLMASQFSPADIIPASYSTPQERR